MPDTMTPELAAEHLSDMVAAGFYPELDGDELGRLLAFAVRHDIDGAAPTAEGWTPTYNLHAAAAEGWRRKAGKAAADRTIEIDNQSDRQSDIHRHCLQQAEFQQQLADREDRAHGLTAFSNALLAADASGSGSGSGSGD